MGKTGFILEMKTQLKDGTPVLIRDLRDSDKGTLSRGMNRLSMKSRYYRFLTPLRRLTGVQLDYLTHVDQVNHFALGARDLNDSPDKGIGVARYIRLDEKQAEFSITIVDEYQGKGLGSKFMNLLIEHAGETGFKELVGYVHRDNLGMIALLERCPSYSLITTSSIYKAVITL